MASFWGPGTNVPRALTFDGAPYAPFSKGDKLGKVADWAADPTKEAKDYKRAQGRGFRDPYHAYGASASSFFTADEPDSSWSFSVVDSSLKSGSGSSSASFMGSKGALGANGGAGGKAVLRARGNGRPGAPNVGMGRMGNNFGTAAPHGQAGAAPPVSRGPQLPRGARTMTIGSATQHNRRGGGRMQSWQNEKLKSRKPSVPIGADWNLVQANNFSDLQKLNFALPTEEVIGRYGFVQRFDRKMDKLTAAERLKSVEVTEYNVTTSEDPVFQKVAASAQPSQEKPHIYATDAIIALLMCATKSNNPWDIIVTKKDNRIYFDKRDNSAIDLPSVDENSMNPPADVADNKIDSAAALALEASYINLNFAANVIEMGVDKREEFEHQHPFSAGDEPESAPLLPKGYIYKTFNLETDPEAEPQPLTIRMEVDAAFEKNGTVQFAKVHALNEYGGSKPLEWRKRFATHRGAIVAAEMKKNLNKLSQWTTRSLLGGSDALKIGFVSRTNAKDNQAHEIIAVLTQNPVLFAKQLGINMANGWGIIKSLVNIFAELDDGKYVVMRDPNAPSVMIYNVPLTTNFEEKA